MNGAYPDLTDAAKLIAQFEGFRQAPYLDLVGVPTIGYGTTYYPNGAKVSMNDGAISEATALSYLMHALTNTAAPIWAWLSHAPTPGQWAAMLSLAYNIGLGAFKGSTVLRDFNAGNIAGAADAFLMWDKGHDDGQLIEIPGLRKRREAERATFLSSEQET